jgi:hypothetical protein
MKQRHVKSVPQNSCQPVVWLLTAQFVRKFLFALRDLNFDYIHNATTATIITAAAATFKWNILVVINNYFININIYLQ